MCCCWLLLVLRSDCFAFGCYCCWTFTLLLLSGLRIPPPYTTCLRLIAR